LVLDNPKSVGHQYHMNMNLLRLARLLLQERWRKIGNEQSWPARLSACLVLLVGAGLLISTANRALANIPADTISVAASRLVTAWVLAGVLVGKDLTWHTRLERLTFFPLGFLPLYSLALALGFLSFPLLLVLSVIEAAFLPKRAGWLSAPAVLLGFCIIVCYVRLSVSLIRTALYRHNALTPIVRVLLSIVIALIAVALLGSNFDTGPAGLLPGHLYGPVLLGVGPLQNLALMSVPVILLATADYLVQRQVVYSGVAGPSASRTRKSKSRFLLFHPSPSATLRRISLLGWIRHRNALVALIWGTGYGFTYMYLAKPDRSIYFMAFSWMCFVFHAYLRGNLLGVDNRAVWFYYVSPLPIDTVIRAKNSSLSGLQLVMVGAVLLPALLRRTPGMTTPIEWAGVISFALCGAVLGEILGSVFSVLHPQPIDRSSMYSGGTTPGALLVPLIQTISLAILVLLGALARYSLGTLPTFILFALAPVSLWVIRAAVLRGWVRQRMWRRRESIMRKLMGS